MSRSGVSIAAIDSIPLTMTPGVPLLAEPPTIVRPKMSNRMREEDDGTMKKSVKELHPGDRIPSNIGTYTVVASTVKGSKVHVQVEPRSPEGAVIIFSASEIVEVA
jgi:hypothetical protein